MSKNKSLILRVQSSEGTKRINVESSDSIKKLFEKVHQAFQFSGFTLYREKSNKNELSSTLSKTVLQSGLRHGDMLYLVPLNGALLTSDKPTSMDVGTSNTSTSAQNNSFKQDEIDKILWKLDGKVQRKRDEKFCRHGPNGRCVHCSSLEPYDPEYLKSQNVKHMSFHAYLRKLTSGVDRGKFLSLEDQNCRIKRGCKDHPPWPKGICSKCQPNAITLNRQVYRHVDNVTFENAHLVERFINYWRATGHQRVGYLLGRYEVHQDVPLGIRATVAAIYEPPQESTRDSITLLDDDKSDLVNELAQALGLVKVGWIFTDLIADDVKKGTVKHVRNIESHFLSASECIMAGHFQNQHPNPCRFAPPPNRTFGSKFATVCVTGDKTNQVHMEGYQVSNQCMALVRDDCLVPTRDVPELGYVRESTDRQYVPDVFYKEKDSYGNEVPRIARPLPVEYLLVDVPVSTPMIPLYTFTADPDIQPFAVENRMVDGHIQDFTALSNYMAQFDKGFGFLRAASDFHFLLYISTMDMLPMKEFLAPLLEAVKSQNAAQAAEWSQSEHWATVEQLIVATAQQRGASSHMDVSASGSRSVASGGLPTSKSEDVIGGASTASGSNLARANSSINAGGQQWTCPYCTFLNPSDLTNCDMCNLPRYND